MINKLSKKVKRVVAIRDGKISSERVLKEGYKDRVRESGIDWFAEESLGVIPNIFLKAVWNWETEEYPTLKAISFIPISVLARRLFA